MFSAKKGIANAIRMLTASGPMFSRVECIMNYFSEVLNNSEEYCALPDVIIFRQKLADHEFPVWEESRAKITRVQEFSPFLC